jgi:pimeloyl-ACP methyl ester carboxylesterase
MDGFEEQHLGVDGLETAFLVAGEGDPLVFFHGGGIVEGFDCFLPLAERFRLVVPYHPGFGPTADDPGAESVDDWVRHYVALFDLLGIETLTLFGHSLGGWLAARLAGDHVDRVRRLVLACPFGLDVPEHPLANVRGLPPEEVYGVLTRDPTVFEGRLRLPLDDAFLAERGREARSIMQVVPGPFDPALPRRIARLTMPTLLLWGDDDQVVPPGHAPIWDAALPNAELRIFAGRGHLLFHEDPDAVRAVSAFASGAA